MWLSVLNVSIGKLICRTTKNTLKKLFIAKPDVEIHGTQTNINITQNEK